jgi:hypothetical protein
MDGRTRVKESVSYVEVAEEVHTECGERFAFLSATRANVRNEIESQRSAMTRSVFVQHKGE